MSTRSAAGDRVRFSQTTDHPERMRLVFTTQLHHQLQTVARNREFTVVPGTNHHGHATRGREVNGWEIEKKMVLLKELRPLLEQPFFLYSDCGSHDATASANNGGGSGFFSMDVYFNKTLPLETGQQSLLDLWEYLLDMCGHVPTRNRCRSLYLQSAMAICRRIEFIRGSFIDSEPVMIDESVSERYYALLRRCIALCTVKLTQSRILLEENALFLAQVYSTVCMRLPDRAGRVLEALVECTRVLEDRAVGLQTGNHVAARVRAHSEPSSVHVYPYSMGLNAIQRQQKEAHACRSPQKTRRHWNGLTDLERRNSELRVDERTKAILGAFSRYKLTRRLPAKRRESVETPSSLIVPSISRRTVERALCEALETGMEANEPITPAEAAFIMETPALSAFSGGEKQIFHRDADFAKEVDEGLDHFVNRLVQPGRDDLLMVYFVGAFLRDRHFWCHAAIVSGAPRTSHTMMWHCVPGYFCTVRAFFAVFKRMCQRRSRTTTTPQATIGNALSIIEALGTDPWTSYWSPREVNVVIDAMSEVVRNPRLTNVLVQIVFEGTNILDAASVNYSITVLQRVVETAAAVAEKRVFPALDPSMRPTSRGCLGDAFDDVYFCSSMRKAMQSSHVQILLKTLTFLYSSLDLLPSRGRRRIISDLVIRENFFRFFLHWNEEIRKIYSYIIVFKVFASNRLDLPCTADHILLAHSPFFPSITSAGSTSNGSVLSPSTSSPSFGYWFHLGDIAQSMLKSPPAEVKDEQKRDAAANALANLMAWEVVAPALAASTHSRPRRVSLFHASLDDEDVSVDLLVASKLDTSLKMLGDQVARNRVAASQYFPIEQEAYADRALSQYVHVLWEYYTAAADATSAKPIAPKLEFTISIPFANEAGRSA